MSMALDLIFVNNHGRGFRSIDMLSATNVLGLDQDYGLFGQVNKAWMGSKGEGVKQACSPKLLPPGIGLHMLDEEKGWATETTTPYGEPLTYVTAKELSEVDLKDQTPWNKAVFAMVKALPADCPVVLWWH